MKTIKTNTIKKAWALCCGLLLSLAGFSQAHVTMSLKNITATTNTIEFDLYIVNDGHTPLKLSACSYGVNFDASILNGGKVTYSYATHSRSRALDGLTDFSLASTQLGDVNQLRMTSMPSKYEHAAALIPEVPLKVGRFRMTNSVSWTANSYPSFSLMENKQPRLTTTQLVGYKDNTLNLMAMTPTLKTVSTEVEDSPILNPSVPQTESTAIMATDENESVQDHDLMSNAESVKVYPNPVMEEMNIDFLSENMGTVKIQITDLHGRLLRHVQANTVKGINKIKIDLSELASGLYTIRVFDAADLNYSQNFSKQ